jgi:DNA polymerase
MNPKVICSLGNFSTKFFLADGKVGEMDKMPGITSVHGKPKEIIFLGNKILLLPLFHPAAIIYNQHLLPLWEKDMEVVKKIVADLERE